MLNVAIIGAGAAGLMAACAAGESGNAAVTLFEKNSYCGKKIGITGKGRCNVTNTASVEEMLRFIPRGSKFLLSALHTFPPEELRRFFEDCGVPLKTERGGRVFPVSDKAADVASALTRKALSFPTVSLKKEAVLSVEGSEGAFRIRTPRSEYGFDRVLIATGGASYPATGSDGDGYLFAERLGHRIVPLRPSLIPLLTREKFPAECMGLSLKNTALRVETEGGKRVYEDFGEMLFCHFGVSGPMILSASAYLDFDREKQYRLYLDLKPALSEEELDKRILSDFSENINRDLVNAVSRLYPQKMIRPLLKSAGLDERKKVHLITRAERLRLVRLTKELSLTAVGLAPLEGAIITRGGVDLKEISPKTMESRLVKGLYFAGEVLDADALTGGFNLQIAFSTGYLAGKSISQEVL